MKKFILGLSFGLIFIPIIDSLLGLFQNITLYLTNLIAIKNKKIASEAIEKQEYKIPQIGFEIPSSEEEWENEEGDDE